MCEKFHEKFQPVSKWLSDQLCLPRAKCEVWLKSCSRLDRVLPPEMQVVR